MKNILDVSEARIHIAQKLSVFPQCFEENEQNNYFLQRDYRFKIERIGAVKSLIHLYLFIYVSIKLKSKR